MDQATIINHLLSVIGESGVSASTSLHPSVQTATRILETEDADFQQIGWWFNTEYSLTLVPDTQGSVIVPGDALEVRMSSIKTTSPSEKQRYVRRANVMYDTIKHTDKIGKSLVVDVVMQLPIASLPSVAASYLMHKSAEAIYLDDDGDSFKSGKLEARTARAWQRLKAAELKVLAVNALDAPFAQLLQSGIGSGLSRTPNLIGGVYR